VENEMIDMFLSGIWGGEQSLYD